MRSFKCWLAASAIWRMALATTRSLGGAVDFHHGAVQADNARAAVGFGIHFVS